MNFYYYYYYVSANIDSFFVSSHSDLLIFYINFTRYFNHKHLNLSVPNNTVSFRRVIGMFFHYSKWIPRFSNKIRSLVNCKTFELKREMIFKDDIANSLSWTVVDNEPLAVETDASDFAIVATLTQMRGTVAIETKISQELPWTNYNSYSTIEN